MRDPIADLQTKIHGLIPVDGNRYFTPYGFYACKVIVLDIQGDTLHLKIILVSERDGSQPSRVCRITGTLQAIKKDRVSLVLEIHKWAQLKRDQPNYWVAQMEV
jgi:hypothetical protein